MKKGRGGNFVFASPKSTHQISRTREALRSGTNMRTVSGRRRNIAPRKRSTYNPPNPPRTVPQACTTGIRGKDPQKREKAAVVKFKIEYRKDVAPGSKLGMLIAHCHYNTSKNGFGYGNY